MIGRGWSAARVRDLEDSICRIAAGVVVGVTLLLALWLAGGGL